MERDASCMKIGPFEEYFGCWFGARLGRLLVCLCHIHATKERMDIAAHDVKSECDMKICTVLNEYFGWWSEAPGA